MPIHVVKIGGSLLAQPHAMGAINVWLEGERTKTPRDCLILLVGGGPVVEGLRTIDGANPLTREGSHWAAVAMMDQLTRLASEWIPSATIVDTWTELRQAATQPGVVLFAATEFLRFHEPKLAGTKLAVGWRVTSDSISARVAEALEGRLTLLKGAPVPPKIATVVAAGDWPAVVDEGWVDPFFPKIAGKIGEIALECPLSAGPKNFLKIPE